MIVGTVGSTAVRETERGSYGRAKGKAGSRPSPAARTSELGLQRFQRILKNAPQVASIEASAVRAIMIFDFFIEYSLLVTVLCHPLRQAISASLS